MSWFDSSFSFARTALSQAQRSIDKALDIHEEQGKPQELSSPGSLPKLAPLKDTPTTSSSTSPSSEKPKTSPKFSTSTPKTSTRTKSTSVTQAASLTIPSVVASPPQDSFTSTWGGADLLWSSLASPVNKKEPVTPVKPVVQSERPASTIVKQSKGVTPATTELKEGSRLSPHPKSLSSPASGSTRTSVSGKYHQERKNPGSEQESESKRAPPVSQHSVPASTSPGDSPTHREIGGTVERQNVVFGASREENSLTTLRDVPLSTSTLKSGTENRGDLAVPLLTTWALPPFSDSHVLPIHHTAGTTEPAISLSACEEISGDVAGREEGDGRRGDEEEREGWEDLVVPPEMTDSESKKLHKESVRTLLPETSSPPLPSSDSPSLCLVRDGGETGDVRSGDEPVMEERERWGEEVDLVVPPEMTDDEAESKGPLLPESMSPLLPSSYSPSLCLATDEASLKQSAQLTEEAVLTEVTLSQTRDALNSPPLQGDTELETMVDSDMSSPTVVEHQLSRPSLSPVSPHPISHSPLPTSPLTTSTPESPPHSKLAASVLTLETTSPDTEKPEAPREGGVEEAEGGDNASGGGFISTGEQISVDFVVKSDLVLEERDSGGRQREGETTGERSSAQHNSPGLEAIQQELVRVQKLLEVRETRMVEMSREMIQLTEANQELQCKLSAAEEDLHTGQGGVDELRSEFAKRISATEKKLQTVIKERDSLKKQLQVLTTEHSHQKESASQELTTLLKEKEEQIAGLMEEGEKLSKKELQNSNIIKKLKEKNKQNDQLLTSQRQQIEDVEREVSRLKDLVKKKEDNEKKYQESLAQLNTIAEQQDKELTALKAERDNLVDKARSLQANLDNAYKELSELHKVTAVNKSVAHEALLSAEQTARQELTEVREKQRVEAHHEKEKLLLEIGELRASVSRCEQQAAWREERMKQEVGDMQQRLQEAEMRNQELTTSISQTTKPFLRQIETLHTAHSTQTANWEKVEASLTQRLVEAQTQLSTAIEKERSSTEKTLTLQSRVTALEKQTALLRQDKSRVTASLELEKAKAETLEEGQQRDSAKMEAVRASLQQSLEDLRKEKEMLERQLEYERVRLEAESRKACLESQEKERLRSQLANSLSRGLSRQSSTASRTHSQSEILEKSLVREMSEGGGMGGSVLTMDSLHHSKTPTTSASAIERLQSLLKQKEGELANAQNLVSSLERSRAAVANDLAAVSSHNVELTEKVNTIPHLSSKLQEFQKRNEALLQMYGEKAEQAEELKLDIQDLKDMYRQQIDDLTKR